jgi:hypothetical protein
MSSTQPIEREVPVPLPQVAPSATPDRAPQHHTVQFYENDTFLEAAVADYLAEGLRSGQVDVVIATPAHRESFAVRLKAKGIDPVAAVHSGRLVMHDARETLSTFMIQSTPNWERFVANVGTIIEGCIESSTRSSVRMYGEMVDLLWKDGNVEAALRLEEFWNVLQQRHSFGLMCAYAMGNFCKGIHSTGFDRVCQTHSHVFPTEQYLDLNGPNRLREISSLQQRAQSLESEVEHRAELEQRLRIALAAKGQAEEDLRHALAERELLLERERAARMEAESANRAKSEFLALMSHELRTPLNAIGGHVQLLEMGLHGPVSEAQRTALQRVERSQKHLLALVNDILNLKAKSSR